MNISTTTQPQPQVAATPEFMNAQTGARIEQFLMCFIIAASLFCVAYLLEGGDPVSQLIADYQGSTKATLGFLAN